MRPQWKTLGNHTTVGEPGRTIESLKTDLEPYREGLEIIESVDNVTVKPKRFLGRDFSPSPRSLSTMGEAISAVGGSLDSLYL